MKPVPDFSAPILPLRDARKAFTRARICDAARQVFLVHGYGSATIEQIAAAAGTRRSTLYTHYRDKEEILDAITDDYAGGLRAVVALVPGPAPSRAQIDAWVMVVAEFVMKERVPTVVLSAVGDSQDMPAAIGRLSTMLIEVLASRLPAFQLALPHHEPPSLRAQAHAVVVIRTLSWCCLQFVRHEGTGLGSEFLGVAAEQFYRFICEFEEPVSGRAVSGERCRQLP